MKRIVTIALSVMTAAALAACGGEHSISNGDMELRLNSEGQIRVVSSAPGAEEFHAGWIDPDALVAKEFTASSFKVKDVAETTEDGDRVWVVTSDWTDGGYGVEKTQRIVAPADFPGMLLFSTSYRNTGAESATVVSWRNHELRVDAAERVWSFQPSSSEERADWILPVEPGYYKRNWLGMNNSDYGGGMPLVNMWRKDGGVVTGITEPVLKTIAMPVEWAEGNGYASIALTYEFPQPVSFAPGDEVRTFDSFVAVHSGDFYNALAMFTRLMESKGMVIPESDPGAFEPVWCAWGYERTFTIDEVLGTLPKVKELGFKWVDIDDGYQIAEGDWETNSRFPGGDRDMRRMTDAVHALGMKAKLWWAPLAADPTSQILKTHPEMELRMKDGKPEWITWWDSYYLSPVNPATEKYTSDLVHRFMSTWGFDGLKLDGQHLNDCEPDYNPASGLTRPEESSELMPLFFKNIYELASEYKPGAVIQLCPCGCAMNFFHVPYFNQAVASDPTSSWQIRLKGKAYRAINQKLAYYADHVELSDGGDDFGTQIGIGGVVGSKFTWPEANPNVKEQDGYLLTPEKEVLYKKWVGIYNDKMLSRGEYLNLYDIAYDLPEGHVIRKDDRMYYAFYADQWNGEPIELRGLGEGTHTVHEYTSDEGRTYTVEGANPVITPTFTRNYLIEVY